MHNSNSWRMGLVALSITVNVTLEKTACSSALNPQTPSPPACVPVWLPMSLGPVTSPLVVTEFFLIIQNQKCPIGKRFHLEGQKQGVEEERKTGSFLFPFSPLCPSYRVLKNTYIRYWRMDRHVLSLRAQCRIAVSLHQPFYVHWPGSCSICWTCSFDVQFFWYSF